MAQHSPPASIGSAGSPYANRAVPAHNPRIVGPMPAHTPRTAGPMPRQTELLDLIEDYQEGGVWGIGLNLELSPPHHVLHVDNLVCVPVCACWHFRVRARTSVPSYVWHSGPRVCVLAGVASRVRSQASRTFTRTRAWAIVAPVR